MKRRFKRPISIILSAMLAFSMLAASTFVTNASDSGWQVGYSGEFWAGYTGFLYLYSDKVDYNEDISSVKSSNKSVGKIDKAVDVDTYIYYLECKKAGKTTLTIAFKTPEGKKKTLKKTITVKKYPNEFKSLKINSKKINTKKDKFTYNCKTSKKKVNIKAELKKGWKISKIEAKRYDKNWEESKVKVTKKMLRKGSAISFPKKYEDMLVTIHLTKGNDNILYEIEFSRP